MAEISRRAALGSVAASAITVLGATVQAGATAQAENPAPKPKHCKTGRPVKPMTLEEFRQMDGPFAADDLFQHLEGHTFAKCHEDMRENHGVWIPELVPVFEQLDALRAANV